MSFTTSNHYVPQWYQRLFLSSKATEKKLYYLDLNPDQIKGADGKIYTKKSVHRWGPVSCFCQDDLYTLQFGAMASDVIEKHFFGAIDRNGMGALLKCADYEFAKYGMDCVRTLAIYMDAQKLRTPKGLDYLKAVSGGATHEHALYRMGKLSMMHVTIWMEGIWEILRCDHSPTKFILSDHPVTTYNKGAFPAAPAYSYPNDPGIEQLGTHTLFPLTPDRLLVITNLGYVRNPNASPLQARINPRTFGDTVMFAGNIQTGRHLREEQVVAVNYIMKMRARRFIAAGEEDWLYPEARLKRKMWDKLGGQFFLSPDPRKVSFTTGLYVGWKDGSSSGWDEYGRPPDDEDPKVKAQRELESHSFYQAREAWEKQFGIYTPKPHGF